MNKYRVLVNATNFNIQVDEDKASRIGFFVNMFVEAQDPEKAELTAVDILRNDDWLISSTRNPKNDPPMLHVEEFYPLKSFKGHKPPRDSFIFYREKPSKKKRKKP